MIEVVIGSAVGVILAFAGFCVKIEHRITKVETKLDLLLNHNGISSKQKPKKEG
jgi:hypothetical protein